VFILTIPGKAVQNKTQSDTSPHPEDLRYKWDIYCPEYISNLWWKGDKS